MTKTMTHRTTYVNLDQSRPKYFKVRLRSTDKVIEVYDAGPKFIPRYWDDHQGYFAEQLDFTNITPSTAPNSIQHPDALLQLL
ncbi:MAG: hypothetical protein JRN68_06360 [Nitrososphaerota archaeon]|nr:hypothetical protein [Ferrimicrobium acidiphilum]MDG6934304.1 hypothetical protein [Nitrososphaerota archaeon]